MYKLHLEFVGCKLEILVQIENRPQSSRHIELESSTHCVGMPKCRKTTPLVERKVEGDTK
jgi:hypothetical protein